MKKEFDKRKYLPFLFLAVLFVFGLVIGFTLTNNTSRNENLKGFIVLEDERIAEKVKYQEDFVILSCNSAQKNCSDLIETIKETDIVKETQVAFLDVYKYVENVKNATEDERVNYISEYGDIISRYSLSKIPAIQIYSKGVLKDNNTEIFSENYLNKTEEEQASELEKIKDDLNKWYKENK